MLYKTIAEKSESDIDFNLDSNHAIGSVADMKRFNFVKCMLSVTEFYLLIAITMVILQFAPSSGHSAEHNGHPY